VVLSVSGKRVKSTQTRGTRRRPRPRDRRDAGAHPRSPARDSRDDRHPARRRPVPVQPRAGFVDCRWTPAISPAASPCSAPWHRGQAAGDDRGRGRGAPPLPRRAHAPPKKARPVRSPRAGWPLPRSARHSAAASGGRPWRLRPLSAETRWQRTGLIGSTVPSWRCGSSRSASSSTPAPAWPPWRSARATGRRCS